MTQACAPPLTGITFLGSSQWSIRSAQCCISFVREPMSASGPCSVLLVEPFNSRIIEMRELQLDDIAIPCLSVSDLFVVRQGREAGPVSVGTMFGLGVNTKQPQALVERVVR